MKKLLAFVLAWGMVFSSVSAIAQGSYIKGVLKDNTLTVTHTEGETGIATVMVYDEGKLCGAKTARLKDGAYTFDVTENDTDMRIFFHGDKAYPLEVVTPTPEPTPTPKPVKTPYPEAYEKPIDAINAPAVVSDVAKVAVEGEVINELSVWYQGRLLTTAVRDNVVMQTAPAAVSYLVGKDVTYLEAGDVVHLTSDLQGRVKSIEFIYRPDFARYFEDGISTAGMIGTDNSGEYYFGTAVETYKSAIEIAGADGRITDLDASPEAIVYTVTKTRKGAEVALDGTGPRLLPKAFVPDENIAGNVIDWNGVTEIPYVLARESRGVVTDIIVFR